MRDLKRGEIKQILSDGVAEFIPEFTFLVYKKHCYTYQRERHIGDVIVHELFHINFSLSNRNLSCSVASRLNKALINDNSYNGGMINPHVDLISLKKGTGAINILEAYYFHDGKFETTAMVVEEMFKDLKNYGLDFFNKQFDRLLHNQIIQVGLSHIKSIPKLHIKSADDSFSEKLQLELKERLFDIKGQSREDRKEIVRTARELINLYFENLESIV
ncbi:MAG: hypothetical protein AAGC65_08310 [Mucilaginibacter sp.]|uniref:hypothetical protein n=1 Tax=Mucilaginibacter sp. TaxID=1882438 RepID=UPI0031ADAD9C